MNNNQRIVTDKTDLTESLRLNLQKFKVKTKEFQGDMLDDDQDYSRQRAAITFNKVLGFHI